MLFQLPPKFLRWDQESATHVPRCAFRVTPRFEYRANLRIREDSVDIERNLALFSSRWCGKEIPYAYQSRVGGTG